MSQKIALFVSEEKLKSFTAVNFNTSPKDFVPYIKTAQDIYLQNTLGATYYKNLENHILNGTVSGDDQFIIDNYLCYIVLHYALYQALPWLKYKIFNKSVLSPTSENADTIELDELKFLQQQCQDTAEFYAKRATEWMILHPGSYPLYVGPNPLDGMMPDYGNPYFGSIVTPHQPYALKRRMGNRNGNMYGWLQDGCEWMFPGNSYVPGIPVS
jgi:hypothetical protein